jgi:oligoendopeptidase F
MHVPSTQPFPLPPRRWLPAGLDVTDEPSVAAACDELLARPLPDAAALTSWLLDVDELESALEAVETRARIAATRDTTDPGARARHLHIQQRLLPFVRPRLDALDRHFLQAPARAGLPAERWAVLERLKTNRAQLFRPANVPLAAREAELVQRHDEHLGALAVAFRGECHTPQAMARWLDHPDRATREEAFRALSAARLSLSDVLSELFEELLALRRELAANAGLKDYRDYRFRELERFDYGPAECEAFAAAVELQVVPVVCELREARRRALGLSQLRPWDLFVDPTGLPPLRPFRTADELAALGERLLRRVDPELGSQFAWLRAAGQLDLANRPGKAPGGYNATLHDVRLPFIFANAVGLQGDVRTLLHEAGHAFHTLACRDQPVVAYRHAPMEFCEVASMSMELLTAEHYAAGYAPADAVRARRQQLEHSLTLLPWVATIDSFQHWLYTYPEHTRSERAAYWTALRMRFEPDVDWSGHMEWLAVEWQRQLHLFRHPFYYIEYGLAQVGALQVWLNARHKGREAIEAYRAALALGSSRPLPELFTAAHACFDFGPPMLGTLARAVRDALAEMEPEPKVGARA